MKSNIQFKRVIHYWTGSVDGVIAYQYDFDANVILYGVSKRHPNDPYERNKGFDMALERLSKNPKMLTIDDVRNKHDDQYGNISSYEFDLGLRSSANEEVADFIAEIYSRVDSYSPNLVFSAMLKKEKFNAHR